jgi:hypothetical protein
MVRDYVRAKYPHSPQTTADDKWEIARFQETNASPTVLFLRNPRETQRMAAQQGFFSFSPQILADHQGILTNAARDTEDPGGRFFQMVVPADLKAGFRRRLWHLNVTAQSRFPGIDGLGRSMSELIQLDTVSEGDHEQ